MEHFFIDDRFYSDLDDYINDCFPEGIDELPPLPGKTEIFEEHPKTIVNKTESPDLPFDYSLNPYQGCEHGCVYCYARNSHEYWGYSAGKDFEQIILVKKSAPELVRQTLQKKNWKPELVTFSGNTDCYQPIERKLELTRNCLKVFAEFKHPVAIITKNAMVERDADQQIEGESDSECRPD